MSTPPAVTTMADYSNFVQHISTDWISGLGQLFERLTHDYADEAKRWSDLADYHYERAQTARS
jgi:hypothetical protein